MLHPPAHHRGTAPMTRDEIFSLLEKNQISMRPDDGAAISVIEKICKRRRRRNADCRRGNDGA